MKESNIAKIYSEILLLPQKEADRLKFWKNPTKQPAGSPTGDFVQILMQVIENRCKDVSEDLKIHEINQKLDLLV